MHEILESSNLSALESIPEYKNAIIDFEENLDYLKSEVKESWPPTNKFGGVILHKTKKYTSIPGVEQALTPELGTVTYKNALIMPQQGKSSNANHKETYYTDKSKYFPTSNIERRIRSMLNADRKRKDLPEIPKNQPVLQYADDGTIRDIDGYIIVAANLETYRRGTLVMTTLGPGRVYDTGKLGPGHFDIYTHWPVKV